MGAFLVAVHQGQLSQQRDATLVESTVANTIKAVAATFRENGHNDPQRMPKITLANFYDSN
jgi:hypothetical protein